MACSSRSRAPRLLARLRGHGRHHLQDPARPDKARRAAWPPPLPSHERSLSLRFCVCPWQFTVPNLTATDKRKLKGLIQGEGDRLYTAQFLASQSARDCVTHPSRPHCGFTTHKNYHGLDVRVSWHIEPTCVWGSNGALAAYSASKSQSPPSYVLLSLFRLHVRSFSVGRSGTPIVFPVHVAGDTQAYRNLWKKITRTGEHYAAKAAPPASSLRASLQSARRRGRGAAQVARGEARGEARGVARGVARGASSPPSARGASSPSSPLDGSSPSAESETTASLQSSCSSSPSEPLLSAEPASSAMRPTGAMRPQLGDGARARQEAACSDFDFVGREQQRRQLAEELKERQEQRAHLRVRDAAAQQNARAKLESVAESVVQLPAKLAQLQRCIDEAARTHAAYARKSESVKILRERMAAREQTARDHAEVLARKAKELESAEAARLAAEAARLDKERLLAELEREMSEERTAATAMMEAERAKAKAELDCSELAKGAVITTLTHEVCLGGLKPVTIAPL